MEDQNSYSMLQSETFTLGEMFTKELFQKATGIDHSRLGMDSHKALDLGTKQQGTYNH